MVVDVDSERHQPAAPAPPAPAGTPPTTTRTSNSASAVKEADFLWELRKYVLLQATLAATITYSAGMSPPGGFWPDNDTDGGGRLAGDPVLQCRSPTRAATGFSSTSTPRPSWPPSSPSTFSWSTR
ncbi:unnamed protein product [Miscanthus lutarioriparius]|uniref:PGG domain-containing protein n=1 Tax=Miscanthus lutarioriparius TaxID=422564 RepID=A0A811QFU8_9POAL|nr:unnamed protein product [Miscanthus lutarioriparius]